MAVISVIGDSLTNNYTLGVGMDQGWTRKLQVLLNTQAGCRVKVRNWGISGNTTAQMLARVACLDHPTMDGIYREVPDIVILAGGVNDPGNGISAAATQSNLEAMAAYAKDAGCRRVVILGAPYLNFSSGGDAQGQPFQPYCSVRCAQRDAAASSGALFVDFYGYLSGLISSGTETQGSFSWHVQDMNQHLNALGWSYAAQAVYNAIASQPVWLRELRAESPCCP